MSSFSVSFHDSSKSVRVSVSAIRKVSDRPKTTICRILALRRREIFLRPIRQPDPETLL